MKWLICILLTGCVSTIKPVSVDAKCQPSCFQSCQPLFSWESGTADEAIYLLKTDSVLYSECELRRQACVECLNRLKLNHIIR